MSFRECAAALRKYWWIVAITTMLGVGVGAAVTMQTPAQYASAMTFFLRTPTDQIGGAYQGDQFAQKRVNSYVQLADSQRLAQLVLTDTQLNMTVQDISSRISAKGDPNTVLLTLTVTDTDPQRSLDIAESVSKQFVTLVSEIETPPGAPNPTVSLDVTSAATLQTTPVAPRPLLNLAAGGLFGLVLGIAGAVLRELLDTTVRSGDSLRQVAGPAMLAIIPHDETAKVRPLIVDSHARSLRAESMRHLRTSLQFVDVDNPVRVVAITSSVPDEGKSSTATNLAVAFAEARRRVLLIEGDLRRPRIAEYLGLEGSVGLTNVLAGHVSVDEVLQSWGGGLTVLPSGSIPPNPSELLDSQNMQELLAAMRKTFDLVIIDTPPLLPVTDGAIAAAHADGAILVVRYGKTSKNQVRSAVGVLEGVGARLLGSVLNMVPTKGADAYGYGNYYYRPDPSDPRIQGERIALPATAQVEPGPAVVTHER